MWDLGLSGQTVLVTGGNSGIGLEVAREASWQGARVGIIGRNRETLDSAISSLHGEGHRVFQSDLVQFESLDSLVDEIVEVLGPPAGLVHAAGIYQAAPLRMSNRSSLEKIFFVNSFTPILLSKSFARKGNQAADFSCVFLGSVSSLRGQAGASAYAASKGVLNALVKSLASEFSNRNMRFNAVIAGLVETQMSEGIRAQIGEDAWKNLVESHPLGIGQPSDVANATMFLLSKRSRWITGSEMIVDGGYLAC